MSTPSDLSALIASLADGFPVPADDGVHWEHSILPEERAIEAWMLNLEPFGRSVYAAAAAAVARHAYPVVIERGGDTVIECGILEGAESMDGESAGTQVQRVEAWLASPDETTLAAADASIDPSRQLNVWHEDLNPIPEEMWCWFLEVADLAARAVTHREEWGGGRREESATWPAPLCAARAAVCALKAIRTPEGDVAVDARTLAGVISAALTSRP